MPSDPRYYRWCFPGSPVRVDLSIDAVAGISTSLIAACASEGARGILLGGRHQGVTEVRRFLPVAEGATVRDALTGLSPLDGEAVGIYRTHADDFLSLCDGDLVLADAYFPQPEAVILLVQASAGEAKGCFFFRGEGGAMMNVPLLEFPFDAAILGERATAQASAEEASKEEPAGSVPVMLPAANPPRRLRSVVAAAGLAAAFLLTTGLLLRARLFPGSPAVAVTAPEMKVSAASVEPARSIQLSWDASPGALRGATEGVLHIEDGGARYEVPLHGQTLSKGTLDYTPASAEVAAKLTVYAPEAQLRPPVVPKAARRSEAPAPPAENRTAQAQTSVITPDAAPAVAVRPRTASVRVTVDDQGRVTRARVLPEPGLDESFAETAVATAMNWRFPAAEPTERTLQFREPYRPGR